MNFLCAGAFNENLLGNNKGMFEKLPFGELIGKCEQWKL